jgi:hypothetical protein
MGTMIAPSNKHQSPSNSQSCPTNKINKMLEIHLNKLIKQNIYKTTNKIISNKEKEHFNGLILFILYKKTDFTSFKNNLLFSFPFLQN